MSSMRFYFPPQERGRLIFRTLAFRGGERNVVLSVKFDGEESGAVIA